MQASVFLHWGVSVLNLDGLSSDSLKGMLEIFMSCNSYYTDDKDF